MTAPAFADPVFQSQAVFRGIMRAMATPGTIFDVGLALAPPAPLTPAAAAALLTLMDYETPLWIAPSFAAASGRAVADYLVFHTGAPLARSPDKAVFALVDLVADELRLADFAPGSAEYPDRSTTILAQGAAFGEGASLRLAGPGVDGEAELRAAPLPHDFLAQWAANRARFPLGVDLILASEAELVGLPRSVAISGEAR
ncbi:MAG TPA: phosphonate C-P lyase system protein PhnH [Roseiarcus sp.]|jgi:alpha-D-ribose 1-methylphosphonate 5-triphosphate synthase subunit PhnH